MASAGTLWVSVKPSLEGFGTQVRAELAAQGLGDDYRIKVTADADTGAATAEIAALNTEVDRVDGRRINIDTSGALGGVSLLTTAIVGLGPALLPVAAVGAAALGSMGIAALVGAGAIGSMVLAFQGVGDAVKAQTALTKAVQEYGAGSTQAVTATKNYQQALAQLSPAGQNFVVFYTSQLKPVFAEIKLAAQSGLLPGLQAGLTSAMPALGQLKTFIGNISAALGDLAAEAGKALGGPFWRQFFDFVNSVAAPAVKTLGEAFGNFVQGAAGVMQALYQPVFVPIMNWFKDLSERVKNFGTAAAGGTSSGFNAFLAYVKDAGPLVKDLLGQLVELFKNVAQAMAGQGVATLSVLVEFLRILNSLPQPVIAALIDLFVAVKLLSIAAGVVEFFVVLKESAAFAATANAIRGVAVSMGIFTTATLAADVALLPLLATVGIFVAIGAAIVALVVVVVKNWDTIKNFLSATWDAIKNTAIAIWNAIASFFSGLWDGIKNTAISVFTSVRDFFVAVWNGIAGFLSGVWDGIRNVATTVFNAILDYFSRLWDAHSEFVKRIWNGLLSFFSTIWDAIKGVAIAVWNAISDFFVGAWNAISAVWTAIWNAIASFFSAIWNAIRDTAVSVWNAIVDFLRPALQALSDFWNAIWSGISSFFSTIWDAIRTAVVAAWNAVSGFLTGALNAFVGFWSGIWNSIWQKIVDIWNSITTTISGAWTNILNAVRAGINAVINFINDKLIGSINVVITFFQIPAIPNIPNLEVGGTVNWGDDITRLAAGGPVPVGDGFTTRGPMAIVGEGNPNYPEYVIPTDPKYRGRASSLYSSLGSDLDMMADGGTLAGVRRMADGGQLPGLDLPGASGVAGGGPLEWITNLPGKIAEFVNGVIGSVAGGANNIVGKIAGGSVRKLIEGIGAWVKKKWDALVAAAAALFGGGGGTAVPSGPIMQILTQTAAQFGWSGAQLDALFWIVQHESGFNPNAQNPTSTAYGLFQFLNGTWAGTGIGKTSDPSLQALAGMRYIASRYGSPIGAKAFWQAHNWYDDGGVANMQGFIPKLTNKPERVLNPQQTIDFGRLVDWMTTAGKVTGTGAQLTPRDLAAVQLSTGAMETELRDLNRMLKRRGAAATINIHDQSGDPGETARAAMLQLRLS